MVDINPFVTQLLAQQWKEFEPDQFKGKQALVYTKGTIEAVKLGSVDSTATLCSVDELDAKKIKCGVTFNDVKMWGLDEVMCVEETCVDSGSKI